MDTTISFEKALYMIDDAIKPTYLTKVQELVLRHTWEGKTYSEIASNYNYDSEYIKSVGCELWQLLSKAFGKQVNKSNFSQFIRRQAISVVYPEPEKRLSISLSQLNLERQYWGMAPDVAHFNGRVAELEQLRSWSKLPDCRLIVTVGMVGMGKTSLVTKFAQQMQGEFHYIIWRSLNNGPPITEVLEGLLSFFATRFNYSSDKVSQNLEEQILRLLSYLRRFRCLLIFDDLQSIYSIGKQAAHYLPGYEGYGQFLRSIIGTQHQSLLLATSTIKPKGLNFYKEERVRFLYLKGLDSLALKTIFQHRVETTNASNEWQALADYYLHNPLLLSIVTAKIQQLFMGNIAEFWQQKPAILEEVCSFMARDFDNFTPLEKEISCWLAIDNSANNLEQLAQKLIRPVSKTQLREGLKSLEQRSLLIQNGSFYVLRPLFQEYLKCRLIEKAC